MSFEEEEQKLTITDNVIANVTPWTLKYVYASKNVGCSECEDDKGNASS